MFYTLVPYNGNGTPNMTIFNNSIEKNHIKLNNQKSLKKAKLKTVNLHLQSKNLH